MTGSTGVRLGEGVMVNGIDPSEVAAGGSMGGGGGGTTIIVEQELKVSSMLVGSEWVEGGMGF